MNDMIERARALARLAEKATPGPWGVDKKANDRYWITARRFWVLAEILRNSHRATYPYSYGADAKLIAAAPEMAKLLGGMADRIDALEEALKVARDAIYYDGFRLGWNISRLDDVLGNE